MYFASDLNLANLDLCQAETVHIGDKPLKRVSSTKSLGLRIDQRLVWEEHVDSLCKRISTALGGLRQARRYVPQETLITIYNALIKPLFDYCDIVWGNLNSTLSARLQKLQNRAARIITRKGYDERSLDIRKQLGWDDLETIRRKHTAILMYKTVNKNAPDYLSNLFTSSNSDYDLRGKENRLLLPKFRTEFAKRNSFSFTGAKVWNSIPFNIRSASSLSLFKNNINNLAVI